jgi:D-proline reductase (dithiol) PrdB
VTTAAPFQPDKGDQGPSAPYNASAKFYTVYSGDSARDHDVRIAHVAIDRKHASMDDPGCWFPLPMMRRLADEGFFQLGPRFHGFPTNRSQHHTREVDAPELLARCQADGAHAALLVANCPVCHQSLSLATRHLEANSIATVILGCARDIVEYCSVARFLFSDFPWATPPAGPTTRPRRNRRSFSRLHFCKTRKRRARPGNSRARQTGKKIMPMRNALRLRT